MLSFLEKKKTKHFLGESLKKITQNKPMCIAYVMSCNYILSKAQLFSPLFFRNMVIVPFPL